MRTTLTVDPDVWARLKELANERSVAFKEIVNATLRAGLAVGRPMRSPSPFERGRWAPDRAST